MEYLENMDPLFFELEDLKIKKKELLNKKADGGSAIKNISKEEVIQIHKSKVYDIMSMGFLPGFMYLGNTENRLHCERKLRPSLNVKKGSIGLALNQTCIYPQDSPGGWHIIGSSPLKFFDLKNELPCFASPGDKIKFIEISKSKYESIKKRTL